jgi:hypothetical protein
MKRSMRHTPVCSHFSSMRYVCFGCSVPSLATTMHAPCMKRSTCRTSVCSRFLSMQCICFGCTLQCVTTSMSAPCMKCYTCLQSLFIHVVHLFWSHPSYPQNHYVCTPSMKPSSRSTLVCNHFWSMQYLCFGCSLPSITTTMRVPCKKCFTCRTPVCSRFSSMQYVRFGRSACTTSCKEAELLFVDTQLNRINIYLIRQDHFSWMKINQKIRMI